MRSDAVGAAVETPGVMGVGCLELQDVSCGYDGTPVLEHVSFTVQPGQVCCVLGRNGVGKTTLFSSILRTLPLIAGRVLIGGEDASVLAPAQLAKRVAYVPQAHTPPFPFTVLDVVEMGRTAHLSVTAAPGKQDRELALQALNSLGIAHLHDRLYTQVSGGERQLVLIARALVQQAPLLIMDEPTASLDYGNQLDILAHVRRLAGDGNSVLMTTHSPDQVFQCADVVLAVMGNGEYAFGKPDEVMTAGLLSKLYGTALAVETVRDQRVVLRDPSGL